MKKTKILIIRLSAIGDTIHTIPLACALKKAGDIELGWVVEDKAQQFVIDNPVVDKCFVIPKKKWKKSKNPISNFIEFISIIKKIRKEKYDIVIDTQQLLKSAVIMGLTRAPRRITMKDAREFSSVFANEILNNKANFYDLTYHVVDRNLEFSEYINSKEAQTEFVLPQLKDTAKVNSLIKKIPKKKPIIVISPATTWENKHIDEDTWVHIIEQIEPECNLIFTGSDADKELVKRIISKSNATNYVDLTGQTNLLELAEIFKHSYMVISPDSGSAHIAWATQSPYVITLFTSTSAKRNAPKGEKCFSFQAQCECSPCFKKKCKNTSKNLCTRALELKELTAQILDLIKKY